MDVFWTYLKPTNVELYIGMILVYNLFFHTKTHTHTHTHTHTYTNNITKLLKKHGTRKQASTWA